MATKQRVDIDVVVKNTQRIDKLEQALGKTSASASGLGRAAKVAAGAIAAIGVGAAVRSLVRVGSEVENLGLRFKFLFGSAEEGARAFETLTEFASRVPFSLEQISAASGNLAVVAKDATELKDILEITGNVAAVSGLDFQTAGEQIQRAFSGGIASADIFRERGIRSLLGFKEGATVSIEETRAAFVRVFGKGGQFGGATDEFADTLTGTISMLQDKLFKFQDVASREFFGELKNQLGDLNTFFDENQEVIDQYAKSIGQSLSVAVLNAGKALIFLKDNIGLVKVAFAALIALKIALAANNARIAFLGLGGSLAKLLPVLRATGAVARKHPLILLGTIGAIAGIALFGDEIDKLTAKLFGAEEAMDDTIPTVDEFNSSISETQRLKNLENHILTGNIALYDDYHTAQDLAANKQIYLNEQLQASLPLYEQMDSANRNFIKGVLEYGETELQTIARVQEEKLKRLDKAYNEDQRNSEEYQKAKTNILLEAEDQRRKIREKAEKDRQDEFQKALNNIRNGKFEENKIEEVTQDEKVKLVTGALSSIAKNTATFNRKAFEAYKAIQIAEALMSAKVAIVDAFKFGNRIGGPLLGGVFAAAAGAATLAQVNAIRSQQYPGRERGGPVQKGKGYVVGESGMEYFQPNQNGTIIPNDQMFGNNVTVNFNITATDAQSFDELLVQRRDTIVGVINEALNENGQRSLV